MESPILESYKKEIESQVKAGVKKFNRKTRLKKGEDYFIFSLAKAVRGVCPRGVLEIPPPHVLSDLAVSGVKPSEGAAASTAVKTASGVTKTQVQIPFLNITLDRPALYGATLRAAAELGDSYGTSEEHGKRRA